MAARQGVMLKLHWMYAKIDALVVTALANGQLEKYIFIK
jgi:hypothetical protein